MSSGYISINGIPDPKKGAVISYHVNNERRVLVFSGEEWIVVNSRLPVPAFEELYSTMESLLDDVKMETGIIFPEAIEILEKYKEDVYE